MSDMEEMKHTLEALQKELAELGKGKESTDEEAEQPLRQVMYVPKERKLKNFGGHPKTVGTQQKVLDDLTPMVKTWMLHKAPPVEANQSEN